MTGLIPLAGSFLARKLLSDGTVRKFGEDEASLTGAELVERVLDKGNASSVQVEIKKRPFLVVEPERLRRRECSRGWF